MDLSDPRPASRYYPPRAGGRKPLQLLGSRIRAHLKRRGIAWPTARQVVKTCLQLILPGLAFYFTGQRMFALCTGLGWVVSALLFLLCLGSTVAEIAFVVMLVAHATSILRLAARFLEQVGLVGGIRGLIVQSALVFFLAAFVYRPVRHWFFADVALPLRTSHGVVIVKPEDESFGPSRGELVAFRIESASGVGLVVRSGYALGTVLALSGDKVRFEPDKLIVNATAQRRLATMPTTGELTVPEKSWLIWPETGIQIYGPGPDEALRQQLVKIALVEQSRLVGRPYKWWSGRNRFLNEQVRSSRVR